MTGLLMKDLMMLKCQKQFFFVMGVVGLMFLVIYDNPTLVFGYLTIMFSFIPLTTLAYDDADNGSAYLFTLPVSRKGYLVEKYLFSAGFTLAAALLTLAVVIVACLVKNYAVQPEELGVMVMTCITVSVIFSAVSMPVQLKFGSERSRVAAALTFGGLFGICYGGSMAYVQGRNQPGRTGRRTFHAGMAGSSRTWHLTVGSGIWSFFWNLVENPEGKDF